MNNMGMGMGGNPGYGNENSFMLPFLMMMILCPGMFGGAGENSMIFFLLIFMTMFSGRMY